LQGNRGEPARQRNMVAIFKDGKVPDLDGDYLPEP